ncbi:MAG: superoxide dismutase [Candidatus Atabeyarchaeum deiterrae]
MAEKAKLYVLPKLPYGYKDLEPHMSETQLTIHHQKHHQAYVNGANAGFEKLDKARKENVDLDMKATLKDLSWNAAGHRMHSLFWENLAPAAKSGKPAGVLAETLTKEFGSFDRFKKEFTQAAASVEGSGWAAVAYCRESKRPFIMQIEKHNVNVVPTFRIIMVVDVFEHAYYIDYKNDRAKYLEAFWNIVNWAEVGKRLDAILK